MADLRDPIQFDRAYRHHHSAMLATAERVLRDAGAAEDVVQDVFVHLWRHPDSYDERRGALRAYLTMLTRSRALDRYRSRAVRDAALERSARASDPGSDVHEDAAQPVIRREGRRQVLRALGTLPEDQREAVLLAFGRELTAREIAATSGVPLGTAKSRVRLGLQKARGALAAGAAA
ncbi:MAG: RNA polymerase sigma factor [Nocardioidaceae bacterium]